MKKIILSVEVSETMFEAIQEKFTAAELSKNGNLCVDVSLVSQTVPDKHRLSLLDLVSLSNQQRENNEK